MWYILLFVIGVIVVLLAVSIYFVKTKRLSAYDWSMRSLGLPRGTVRALLAFIILFLLASCILGETTIPELPEWLVGILGAIIGFYFGAASTARDKPPTPPEEDATKKPE